MDPLVALLPIALLVIFGLVLYDVARRQALAGEWGVLARTRSLTYSPPGMFDSVAMTGEVEGIQVRVDLFSRKSGKSSVTYTRVQCTPTDLLPSGLALSPEGLGSALVKMVGGQDIEVGVPSLDSTLRIRGENPADVAALLSDPDLCTLPLALMASSQHNRVEDGTVILEKRGFLGAEAGDLLDEALDIARKLARARLRVWQRVVAAHPDLTLTPKSGRLSLEGTWEGLTLQGRADLQRGYAELRVTVPALLPVGMVVVSGRHSGAIPLGDPVLDGAISVKGASSEVVRSLLRDDALRGDLLSVLHAYPGSRIEQNAVILVLPAASPLDLEARLADVGILARALAARADALARSPSSQAQSADTVRRPPPQREQT